MTDYSHIKALVFDLDGTSVQYVTSKFKSSWDAIGGILPEPQKTTWREHLDYYYPRPQDIIEWTKADSALLKGFPVQKAKDALYPDGKLPYTAGFEDFISGLNGDYIHGILSASFTLVSDKIMQDFPGKFSFAVVNELGISGDVFDGTVKAVDMWDKVGSLEKELIPYGLDFSEIAYFGDSKSDIPVLEKVGLSIVVNSGTHESEMMREYADYFINDFREVNNILNSHQKSY
jgi:phosphoserine phosphatase